MNPNTYSQQAHRAPDPVPVDEPLQEPHPHVPHPVPQDDPVPDPHPSSVSP
ncbi:MAG: hypothetical protein ACI83P_001852 [Janthinobacterium sp.]|jgi:hypothetical protein